MAFGVQEDPALSPTSHLDSVEYPASRDQLVRAAMDASSSVDVINLLKSLPQEQYASKVEVQRDFGEAARRFALGGQLQDDEDGANRDRRNLGRDAVENAPAGHTRHP